MTEVGTSRPECLGTRPGNGYNVGTPPGHADAKSHRAGCEFIGSSGSGIRSQAHRIEGRLPGEFVVAQPLMGPGETFPHVYELWPTQWYAILVPIGASKNHQQVDQPPEKKPSKREQLDEAYSDVAGIEAMNAKPAQEETEQEGDEPAFLLSHWIHLLWRIHACWRLVWLRASGTRPDPA